MRGCQDPLCVSAESGDLSGDTFHSQHPSQIHKMHFILLFYCLIYLSLPHSLHLPFLSLSIYLFSLSFSPSPSSHILSLSFPSSLSLILSISLSYYPHLSLSFSPSLFSPSISLLSLHPSLSLSLLLMSFSLFPLIMYLVSLSLPLVILLCSVSPTVRNVKHMDTLTTPRRPPRGRCVRSHGDGAYCRCLLISAPSP